MKLFMEAMQKPDNEFDYIAAKAFKRVQLFLFV